MEQIKEINFNKYYVIKSSDLKYLSFSENEIFFQIINSINEERLIDKKTINKYIVLNTDDDFSICFLLSNLVILFKKQLKGLTTENLKIIDIATILINSILIKK